MINVHVCLSEWERCDFPKPRQPHVFPADSAAGTSNGKDCREFFLGFGRGEAA